MDEYRSGGLGCIWVAAAAFVILLLIAGGGGHGTTGGTNPTNATNSRTGTLSGNQVEVMSRNQLNLWSDVQNCYGDYSCMTIISTTTSTARQAASTSRVCSHSPRGHCTKTSQQIDSSRLCRSNS
jgi:hypothetical protein